MAETQRGIAVVFGFAGSVSWSGIGTLFNESYDVEDDFQLDEIRDELNDVRTLIGSGQIYRASMRFTPRAASGTNTKANARLSLAPPAMLSVVTFTSVDQALFTNAVAYGAPGSTNANWLYIGGWRQAGVRNGVATYELRICRSMQYDLSVAVS